MDNFITVPSLWTMSPYVIIYKHKSLMGLIHIPGPLKQSLCVIAPQELGGMCACVCKIQTMQKLKAQQVSLLDFSISARLERLASAGRCMPLALVFQFAVCRLRA